MLTTFLHGDPAHIPRPNNLSADTKQAGAENLFPDWAVDPGSDSEELVKPALVTFDLLSETSSKGNNFYMLE